jgi:60S ribosome subunit biogenesis protein NIP7
MQAEEDRVKQVRIREASRRELELVEAFLRSIGLKGGLGGGKIVVLEVEGGPYVELFYMDARVAGIALRLGAAYSGGLNLGTMSDGVFKPSLHLARELAPLCKGGIAKCAVVSPRGEALFLYGKPVYEENIVKWVKGIALVVGADMEPLGWGVGVERGGKRIIRPIRDLGWYLRRGG